VLSCPFCKEELEIVGKGHYFAHKTNGCILQHLCFEIDDDEAVEKWNTRKPVERILERLEENCFWTSSTYDEDGYCNDDSEEVVDLYKAIEIVKEEGGIE
jgi:hypothetical protein